MPAESPEKFDLGNNFIRRGTGLPRTPPRKHDSDSEDSTFEDKRSNNNSKSPVEDSNFFNKNPQKQDMNNELDEPGIIWPSRQKAPDQKSGQISAP